MAINLNVYNNTTGRTSAINIDFAAELRSSSIDGTSFEVEYYFKFITGARDSDNLAYTARIANKLDDLVLNRNVQAATNTTNAYSDIKSMIVDYMYDYIYGHENNKFASGVKYKAPLQA